MLMCMLMLWDHVKASGLNKANPSGITVCQKARAMRMEALNL